MLRAGLTPTSTSGVARAGFAPRGRSVAAGSSPVITTPTVKGSLRAAAARDVRRSCDPVPSRLRLVGAVDQRRVLVAAVLRVRRHADVPRLQPARLHVVDDDADARAS